MKQTKLMIATTLTAAITSWGCAPQQNAGSHVAARVSAATDNGPTSPDELIDFVVGLRVNDYDAVNQAIVGAHAARSAISAADFADRFGVSAAEYASVVSELEKEGFEIVRTAPGRTTITLRGTAAVIEAAFGSPIHKYSDSRGTFRSNTIEPAFNAALAPIAGAVGLSTANPWQSDIRVAPAVSTATYTPTTLRTLYNIPSTVANHPPGTGETIAILGAGEAPAPADVQYFAVHYGKNTNFVTTQYVQNFVGGASRDSDASNDLEENALDADMAIGLAPYATVVHNLVATNSPGLFTDGISYIVNDVPQAHAVSVSYGSCERGAASEMPVLHALMAQAQAEGQQWFFATGDNGSDGCNGGTVSQILSVGWPASEPYIIGVGGEAIDQTGSETAWSGGAGGESESYDKPSYQTGIGPYPNDGARNEPDVAALAGDPGVYIWVNGSAVPGVEGTSAATPMWAAVWALIDQSQGGSTASSGAPNGTGLVGGHANLYTLGSAGEGFRDITTGNNSNGALTGYPAITGYDLATGWGVPNVQSLIANWSN